MRKVKQENFHKPVTAEALKVLKIICDEDDTSLRERYVPGVRQDGTIDEVYQFSFSNTHPNRRCHYRGCFCMITRLEANIIIRHVISTSPEKKALLKAWRERRKVERIARRAARGLLIPISRPSMQEIAGDEIGF